jgi:hypothetical protein
MNYDNRFALIDSNGALRFAQKLNGTFQIGKDRRSLPATLEAFARAVLLHGEGGRFCRADGSKHGILGFRGKSREAVAYELEPSIARAIGVPPTGQR